jgi:intracellular sulfur oxidation DsrE/DsrF family protein
MPLRDGIEVYLQKAFGVITVGTQQNVHRLPSKMREKVPSNKILIHISDRDKWPAVFSQLALLLKREDSQDMKIAILADVFAGTVCIACNPELEQQMSDFVKSGHRIYTCEESLRCLNIRTEKLPDFIQLAPTALGEIIRLLEEGYHYIKV